MSDHEFSIGSIDDLAELADAVALGGARSDKDDAAPYAGDMDFADDTNDATSEGMLPLALGSELGSEASDGEVLPGSKDPGSEDEEDEHSNWSPGHAWFFSSPSPLAWLSELSRPSPPRPSRHSHVPAGLIPVHRNNL